MIWTTWPILFNIGILMLIKQPKIILDMTPKPWSIYTHNITKPIIYYPKTKLEAWDLGVIAGMLQDNTDVSSMKICINGQMVRLTYDELIQMRVTIESSQSTLQYVRGCFTFVNSIWLLSIIGMLTTISPVLMIIAEPVHQLIKYLTMEIILPFLRAIKPVYEAMLWMFCYILIAHAFRYNDVDSQVFICITGLLGSIIAMSYTTYLHRPKICSENYNILVSLVFAVSSLTVAIRLNSVLIGFLGVASLYNALGFSLSVFGLCYIVGFKNDHALNRCLLSSLFLLIVRMLGHTLNSKFLTDVRAIIPALNTLGSVTYFLALLIKTHFSNWQTQFLMILSLVTTCAIGSIYHIDAVRNVSMVFTVLYLLEKICSLVTNLPLVVFIISVCFWKSSLYLHENPMILVSIFGIDTKN